MELSDDMLFEFQKNDVYSLKKVFILTKKIGFVPYNIFILFSSFMLNHSLPQLSYSYDALEPHIDAQTMEIHHSKHHQTYITNYMKLLEGSGLIEKYSPEELFKNLDEVPTDKKQGVINNL